VMNMNAIASFSQSVYRERMCLPSPA
jgi:hypothetical protein